MSKISKLFNKILKKDLSPANAEVKLLAITIKEKSEVISYWDSISTPIYNFIGEDMFNKYIKDLFESCYAYFGDLSFNGKQIVEESITLVNKALKDYKPNVNDKYNAPVFKCAWIHFQILANISVVDRLRVYVSDDENSKFWQFAHGIPLMTFLENESNEVYLEIKTLKRNSLFVMAVMLQHILPVKTKISFGAPLHLGMSFLLVGKDPYHEAFAKWKIPNIKSIDNCYKKLTMEQIQEKYAILKKELKLANDKAKEHDETENNYEHEIEKLSLALVRKEQNLHNELKKLKESINAVAQQLDNGNIIYSVNQQPSSMIPTPKLGRKPQLHHQPNSDQSKPAEPKNENRNNVPVTNQRAPLKKATSKTEQNAQGQPQPKSEHSKLVDPEKSKSEANLKLGASASKKHKSQESKPAKSEPAQQIKQHDSEKSNSELRQQNILQDSVQKSNSPSGKIKESITKIIPPLKSFSIDGIKTSNVFIESPCTADHAENTLKYLTIILDRFQVTDEKKLQLISLFNASIQNPEQHNKFLEQFRLFLNLNFGCWLKAMKRGTIKVQALDDFSTNLVMNARKSSFAKNKTWDRHYRDLNNFCIGLNEGEILNVNRKALIKCGMVWMKENYFSRTINKNVEIELCSLSEEFLSLYPAVFLNSVRFCRETCYRFIGFKQDYPNIHPAILNQKNTGNFKFNLFV